MNLDFTSIMELVLSAIGGGGLVAAFTIPEKKKAAKLENDAKIIAEYGQLIDQYREELLERDKRIDQLQKRIEELEAQSCAEKKTRDIRIAELEKQVRDLESQLDTLRQKRDKNGRYTKNDKRISNGNKD